jgi:plasmid stabilization system protein ParE
MKVILAPLAAQDLREAREHIAQDNPRAADELLISITNALALLASGLVSGADVTLRDGRVVQYWPVPPFRIYYRIHDQELQIARIYHQARRPIERIPRRRKTP